MKKNIKSYLKKNKNIYNLILKICSLFYFFKEKNIHKNNEEILKNYSKKPKEKTYYCNNNIKIEKYDLQIIIPAYNVENYIEECLNSVFSQQTKYNFYVVIINDGSTDTTYSKILKYKNYQNVRIINQKNKGISMARNIGMKVIKAKYIMFLDSDDILWEGAIETLLNNGFKTNADIVEGNYVVYYNKKNYINKKVHKYEIGNSTQIELLGFPWGKILRSNIFKKIRFPIKYHYEDSIFAWLIYPKNYKVLTLDEIVYGYRINTSSVTYTTKMSKRAIESFYITQELIYNGLEIYNIQLNEKIYLLFLKQIQINYIRSQNCPEKIKKAIFFEIQKIMKEKFEKFLGSNKNSYKLLEESILKGQYKKYKFLCKYLRG